MLNGSAQTPVCGVAISLDADSLYMERVLQGDGGPIAENGRES
jgi:hypothetical protein